MGNLVPVHSSQYICKAMWDVEHSLAMASLNIYKMTQSLVENNRSEIKNETEDQA